MQQYSVMSQQDGGTDRPERTTPNPVEPDVRVSATPSPKDGYCLSDTIIIRSSRNSSALSGAFTPAPPSTSRPELTWRSSHRTLRPMVSGKFRYKSAFSTDEMGIEELQTRVTKFVKSSVNLSSNDNIEDVSEYRTSVVPDDIDDLCSAFESSLSMMQTQSDIDSNGQISTIIRKDASRPSRFHEERIKFACKTPDILPEVTKDAINPSDYSSQQHETKGLDLVSLDETRLVFNEDAVNESSHILLSTPSVEVFDVCKTILFEVLASITDFILNREDIVESDDDIHIDVISEHVASDKSVHTGDDINVDKTCMRYGTNETEELEEEVVDKTQKVFTDDADKKSCHMYGSIVSIDVFTVCKEIMLEVLASIPCISNQLEEIVKTSDQIPLAVNSDTVASKISLHSGEKWYVDNNSLEDSFVTEGRTNYVQVHGHLTHIGCDDTVEVCSKECEPTATSNIVSDETVMTKCINISEAIYVKTDYATAPLDENTISDSRCNNKSNQFSDTVGHVTSAHATSFEKVINSYCFQNGDCCTSIGLTKVIQPIASLEMRKVDFGCDSSISYIIRKDIAALILQHVFAKIEPGEETDRRYNNDVSMTSVSRDQFCNVENVKSLTPTTSDTDQYCAQNSVLHGEAQCNNDLTPVKHSSVTCKMDPVSERRRECVFHITELRVNCGAKVKPKQMAPCGSECKFVQNDDSRVCRNLVYKTRTNCNVDNEPPNENRDYACDAFLKKQVAAETGKFQEYSASPRHPDDGFVNINEEDTTIPPIDVSSATSLKSDTKYNCASMSKAKWMDIEMDSYRERITKQAKIKPHFVPSLRLDFLKNIHDKPENPEEIETWSERGTDKRRASAQNTQMNRRFKDKYVNANRSNIEKGRAFSKEKQQTSTDENMAKSPPVKQCSATVNPVQVRNNLASIRRLKDARMISPEKGKTETDDITLGMHRDSSVQQDKQGIKTFWSQYNEILNANGDVAKGHEKSVGPVSSLNTSKNLFRMVDHSKKLSHTTASERRYFTMTAFNIAGRMLAAQIIQVALEELDSEYSALLAESLTDAANDEGMNDTRQSPKALSTEDIGNLHESFSYTRTVGETKVQLSAIQEETEDELTDHVGIASAKMITNSLKVDNKAFSMPPPEFNDSVSERNKAARGTPDKLNPDVSFSLHDDANDVQTARSTKDNISPPSSRHSSCRTANSRSSRQKQRTKCERHGNRENNTCACIDGKISGRRDITCDIKDTNKIENDAEFGNDSHGNKMAQKLEDSEPKTSQVKNNITGRKKRGRYQHVKPKVNTGVPKNKQPIEAPVKSCPDRVETKTGIVTKFPRNPKYQHVKSNLYLGKTDDASECSRTNESASHDEKTNSGKITVRLAVKSSVSTANEPDIEKVHSKKRKGLYKKKVKSKINSGIPKKTLYDNKDNPYNNKAPVIHRKKTNTRQFVKMGICKLDIENSGNTAEPVYDCRTPTSENAPANGKQDKNNKNIRKSIQSKKFSSMRSSRTVPESNEVQTNSARPKSGYSCQLNPPFQNKRSASQTNINKINVLPPLTAAASKSVPRLSPGSACVGFTPKKPHTLEITGSKTLPRVDRDQESGRNTCLTFLPSIPSASKHSIEGEMTSQADEKNFSISAFAILPQIKGLQVPTISPHDYREASSAPFSPWMSSADNELLHDTSFGDGSYAFHKNVQIKKTI
ncbi:uncharacterized protein LOC127842484 [Dreissena polymorpha]|uniref:uncharacterized protein LOC127842484 n=1 Tax=Dreissena polymorpha TaxID=45954 RepID=UPI0022642E93|nr:uncharacterized protein LOC127842484 [Dreissena polymorpha]